MTNTISIIQFTKLSPTNTFTFYPLQQKRMKKKMVTIDLLIYELSKKTNIASFPKYDNIRWYEK